MANYETNTDSERKVFLRFKTKAGKTYSQYLEELKNAQIPQSAESGMRSIPESEEQNSNLENETVVPEAIEENS